MTSHQSMLRVDRIEIELKIVFVRHIRIFNVSNDMNVYQIPAVYSLNIYSKVYYVCIPKVHNI